MLLIIHSIKIVWISRYLKIKLISSISINTQESSSIISTSINLLSILTISLNSITYHAVIHKVYRIVFRILGCGPKGNL